MENNEEKQEGMFSSALNGALVMAVLLMIASFLFLIYNQIIGV